MEINVTKLATEQEVLRIWDIVDAVLERNFKQEFHESILTDGELSIDIEVKE
tara:strand:+ start:823 stop:978 length:156 start_codon:yes stop_codon:yes gene_type:complete